MIIVEGIRSLEFLHQGKSIGYANNINSNKYRLSLFKEEVNLNQLYESESVEQAKIDSLELMIQHYDYLATKFTRMRDESMELKESLLKGV